MSVENVEVLRELNDAANRLDLDAFLACLSPDVIWEENPQLPGLREVYRGRAEVREWMEEALEVAEGAHFELVEIKELSGEGVFAETVFTGRGKGSGLPGELHFWSVLWFAEGKIAKRQVYWTREEALEAAGLRE